MGLGLVSPFVSMQEPFGDVNVFCLSHRFVERVNIFIFFGCVMTLSPRPVVLCKPLAL